jgi:DNA-binding NarL/FixJ family response regulator
VDVLLCDDHLLLVQALAAWLTVHGHRVVAAVTDPVRVVDLAEDLAPDVCILDLGFPDGNGITATREITARVKGTRVLILSASTDPSQIRQSFEAGALGFIRKNDGVQEILGAIRRLVKGEVVIDPRLLRSAMSHGNQERRHPGTRGVDAYLLTPREHDVLELIVAGRNTVEIAEELVIATSTARTHIQNVLMKTGAHSRLEVAALAVRLGLVPGRTRGRDVPAAPTALAGATGRPSPYDGGDA